MSAYLDILITGRIIAGRIIDGCIQRDPGVGYSHVLRALKQAHLLHVIPENKRTCCASFLKTQAHLLHVVPENKRTCCTSFLKSSVRAARRSINKRTCCTSYQKINTLAANYTHIMASPINEHYVTCIRDVVARTSHPPATVIKRDV